MFSYEYPCTSSSNTAPSGGYTWWPPNTIIGYMVANSQMRWPTYIYGDQLACMVANLHIWWQAFIYGGRLTYMVVTTHIWLPLTYMEATLRVFSRGRIVATLHAHFSSGGAPYAISEIRVLHTGELQELGPIPRGCSIMRTLSEVHLWRSTCHAISGRGGEVNRDSRRLSEST